MQDQNSKVEQPVQYHSQPCMACKYRPDGDTGPCPMCSYTPAQQRTTQGGGPCPHTRAALNAARQENERLRVDIETYKAALDKAEEVLDSLYLAVGTGKLRVRTDDETCATAFLQTSKLLAEYRSALSRDDK